MNDDTREPQPERTPGQICYEAKFAEYLDTKGERAHGVKTHAIQPWRTLHEAQKVKWERAALAVLGYADHEVVAVFRPRAR